MDGDPIKFIAEGDIDVRTITVVWWGDACPRLQLGGTGEYEAAGILRAVLHRLEDDNRQTVRLEDEPEKGDDEDED